MTVFRVCGDFPRVKRTIAHLAELERIADEVVDRELGRGELDRLERFALAALVWKISRRHDAWSLLRLARELYRKISETSPETP